MKAPKVASIALVAMISLTLLNFLLKYYTYFVLVVAAHRLGHDPAVALEDDAVAPPVPRPNELFVPFLTFIPTVSPVLARPWVIVTAGFIEDSFLTLALAVPAVFYLGGFLEATWGLPELLRFLLVAVCALNLSLYAYYSVKAAVVGAGTSVPPVVISSVAIVMALIVAVKQRISGHYIILFKGSLRIKVTHLPFLVLAVLGALSLVLESYRIVWMLALTGFISSWVYLRYFKASSNDRQSYLLPFSLRRSANTPTPLSSTRTLAFDNNSRGDRSDLFALVTFFPAPLSSVVKVASDYAFAFMIKRQWVDLKDYTSLDNDADSRDEVGSLQSNLFSLSALKGAGDVSPIPNAGNTFKTVLEWFSGDKKDADIKITMDKRRKLAMRELE